MKNKENILHKINSFKKNIIEGTERYRKILLSSFMSEYIDKKLCFEVNTQYYFTYYPIFIINSIPLRIFLYYLSIFT